MRELALFAGAGGGILGSHLLGWRTVCAVEIDPYCRRVLLARQRDGILPEFPIWDDVKTFDGRPWRGHVDVVSGGFPCQDISCAGKGAGIDGEHSGLWSEFARIIREVGPQFVFVENSPVLTSRGLGVVLGDPASLGFDAEWGVLGADDAGAPHIRKRIWIVAHADKGRLHTLGTRLESSDEARESNYTARSCENATNPIRDRIRLESGRLGGTCRTGAGESGDDGETRNLPDPNRGRLQFERPAEHCELEGASGDLADGLDQERRRQGETRR